MEIRRIHREAYMKRLKELTDVLLDNENMFALCYTQLTDVEQEQNGLYTYDRQPKFDPEIIHAIFQEKLPLKIKSKNVQALQK